MKGTEVKEILQKNGFSLKDVALSMNETPQNLQSMLKVEDIKTGVLERISKAINKDVTYFFNYKMDNFEELKINNEIISKIGAIRYLYQRIVDIDIIINEHYKISEEKHDYINDALIIINSVLYNENNITDYKVICWKEWNIEKRQGYFEELKKSYDLLYDLFFNRFKILYKHIRKL